MIEINNLTNTKINEEFLKKIARKVLATENKKETDLSIALVGPGTIKKLNKKYRKKNRVTDVLAFADVETVNLKLKIPKVIKGLGEIVICPQQVKKNAQKFDSTFKKELSRVLIHGILHFLGLNHEIYKKTRKMEQKQEYYLNLFFR